MLCSEIVFRNIYNLSNGKCSMKIQDFYQKRYSKKAYSDSRGLSQWEKFVLTKVTTYDLNNKKILDIGCGDGLILRSIKNKFKNTSLFGIDLSEDNQKFLKQHNILVQGVDISSEKLPFKDNSLDIIICTEVIEHVFDCQHMVNEMYRVLKKNGTLFITTHNSFNFYMRLKYLLGIIPTGSLDVTGSTQGEHIHLFNKTIFRKLFLNAGFRIQNMQDYSWFKLSSVQLRTRYLTSLFANHLFFIIKK